MTLSATKQLATDKSISLEYFRERTAEMLHESQRGVPDLTPGRRAGGIIQSLEAYRKDIENAVLQKAQVESWTKDLTLRANLLVSYAKFIAELEVANSVRPFDLDTLSTRSEGMWLFVCKSCFHLPNTGLTHFDPPMFHDVRHKLSTELSAFVKELSIDDEQRERLLLFYDKVWALELSGEIDLQLDLHFEWNHSKFGIYFSSGLYGSRIKGHYHQLLRVGRIYKSLEDNHQCILLSQSAAGYDDDDINMLNTSGDWETLAGNHAYGKIAQLTGFNLAKWVRKNVDWMADLDAATQASFKKNNLENCLAW